MKEKHIEFSKTKRLLSFLLVIAMTMTITMMPLSNMPVYANSATYSYSGDTLRITGTGELTSTEVTNGLKSEIKKVEIAGFTSIGSRAFSSCAGLTSIEIPNSVTSIDYGAFFQCYELTSIKIPNSVTSIATDTFSECKSLTNIEIPNSVTSIDESAFYGCINLTSIKIPNSVTSIGDEAFYGCHSLSSIKIPNSVISIGKLTFYNCIKLTSIKIPNSVTSIGENVFSHCSELTIYSKNKLVKKYAKKYSITCLAKDSEVTKENATETSRSITPYAPRWEDHIWEECEYSPTTIQLEWYYDFEYYKEFTEEQLIGFKIERRSLTGCWKQIADVKKNDYKNDSISSYSNDYFVDKTIKTGHKYEYRIRAYFEKNDKIVLSEYTDPFKSPITVYMPEKSKYKVSSTIKNKQLILKIKSDKKNGTLKFSKDDSSEIYYTNKKYDIKYISTTLVSYSVDGKNYKKIPKKGISLKPNKTIYLKYSVDNSKDKIPNPKSVYNMHFDITWCTYNDDSYCYFNLNLKKNVIKLKGNAP